MPIRDRPRGLVVGCVVDGSSDAIAALRAGWGFPAQAGTVGLVHGYDHVRASADVGGTTVASIDATARNPSTAPTSPGPRRSPWPTRPGDPDWCRWTSTTGRFEPSASAPVSPASRLRGRTPRARQRGRLGLDQHGHGNPPATALRESAGRACLRRDGSRVSGMHRFDDGIKALALDVVEYACSASAWNHPLSTARSHPRSCGAGPARPSRRPASA